MQVEIDERSLYEIYARKAIVKRIKYKKVHPSILKLVMAALDDGMQLQRDRKITVTIEE